MSFSDRLFENLYREMYPSLGNYQLPTAERILNNIFENHEPVRCCHDLNKNDYTTVLQAGRDVSPEDIRIEVMEEGHVLKISVDNTDEEGNSHRIVRMTRLVRQINEKEVSARLEDGDIIIYAPFAEIESNTDDGSVDLKVITSSDSEES